MLTERRDWTWAVIGVVVILFMVLVLRLWQLQVVRGGKYRLLSIENRLRIEQVPAPRGIIFDRKDRPLVKNTAYYTVSLLPDFADKADTAEIASFLDVPSAVIETNIKQHKSRIENIRLKEGINFEEAAFIEARLSDHPGLTIDIEQTRFYPYGDVGGHMIGYLGRITARQAEDPTYEGVPRQSFVGQWGIEKLYDTSLRGTPGRKVFEVDALGRKLRLISEEAPVKGNDLYLSMDMKVQREAAVAFGNRAGAVVALKPDTGEVLALVSRPSFDPNLFSRGIGPEEWERLSRGPGFPMLNRALQSQYPPGSTFKIVTALAALEGAGINPRKKITCTGRIKRGKWTFGCWKKDGHGRIDLHRAIVESCDIYFYLAGQEAGIDSIAHYARSLGLGNRTGIPLVREKSGLIPDTAWKRRVMGESWYLGETYISAIGQGYVLTTPAQLARMVSAVASGGLLYELKLTRLDYQPAPIANASVSEDSMNLVRKALEGVVSERHGTGRAARNRIVSVAGKTGTAQVISEKKRKELAPEDRARFEDHAWFVAYAPTEEAEIALSVFVEHGGHGGSAAAPIARKAIEAYMESEKENAEN